MRVAVFHNLSSGGAKRALLELVTRLSVRHDLDVFTLGSADHEFADLRPHVNSHRIEDFAPLPLLASPFGRVNNASRTLDLWRLGRVNRLIARRIENSQYDVVFANPCRYENTPSVISGLHGVPSVLYCQESLRVFYESPPERPYLAEHGTRRALLDRFDPLPGLFRYTLRRRDRHSVQSAGRVLVNSEFSRKNVKEAYGIDPFVSYLGVDALKFFPSGQQKERFLLSVGSLTPLKGFDFLVEAVACMPANHRPPLLIVSNFENPPERSYLEELAAELSVELRLMGNVTEEQLVKLYNQASVVVYSPIREPFGFIPLEAMACGTPVVAVSEGGMQETIIEGQTGLLVERDHAQFAEAVLRIMDNETLAKEYGRNGRLHVEENWTWDRAAQTLEQHLEAGRGAAASSQGMPSIA